MRAKDRGPGPGDPHEVLNNDDDDSPKTKKLTPLQIPPHASHQRIVASPTSLSEVFKEEL